ncbi:hypothetical protein [Leptolyngbya sp. FACHB-261]|uniref:hypothetical protein n=1 Tax=Leptolyngbya sp. FACHB-261 TaxID=2692806 RepID=UPI001683BED6|nr:hypothetical protein [Leptolyngbya sp. FACHB-261]MBD2103595.1 hypothetical protein [Leptolyngbya sp. FACHB-261]
MNQKPLIQHLEKSLLGRLRLKLFSEISKNTPIPSKEKVESFVLEKIKLSTPIGKLYASILFLSDFTWEPYSNLKSVEEVKKLLIALERFPLKNDFFIELEHCPNPLPESIGILIKCSELAKAEHGFVYSVYILGEERFPEAIIDYIEVRACQTAPDPIICSYTIDGTSTSDLRRITDSLTIQVAIKVLYLLLDKHLKKEEQRRQSEIVKATELMPISRNLSARFLKQTSGRMELAIIIKEEASAEELRSAWAKIDLLRTRLRENQGTNLNQIQYSLLYNYHQMHKNGWSYNLIAMDINYDCLVNLCKASDEIISIDVETISSSGFTNAHQLLTSVRMKEKDILDCLLNGLEDIRSGNPPWLPKSGPVDGQRVRAAIRQWEREEVSQKVIVRKPPETKMAPLRTLTSPSTNRYQQMAKELLNQKSPRAYEEYQEALAQTIIKTGYIGYIHSND